MSKYTLNNILLGMGGFKKKSLRNEVVFEADSENLG